MVHLQYLKITPGETYIDVEAMARLWMYYYLLKKWWFSIPSLWSTSLGSQGYAAGVILGSLDSALQASTG